MHWLTGAAYHAVIPAETLGLLAEALLIHIDEIATFSARRLRPGAAPGGRGNGPGDGTG